MMDSGPLHGAAKFAALLAILGLAMGLRNVRLMVPAAIPRGSTTLVCHYDLEGDSLYSVKWYRGRREFFRFTPKEDPSIKVFPMHGMHVDLRRSNASHLFLRHVTPAMSGRYSCEVSADAPSFHTALVSGDMDVVDLPKSRPYITGVKSRYRVGETISGNCSSPPSRPPANLTWAINGKVANPFYVTYFPHSIAETKEPEETWKMSPRVGLQFVIGHQHFSRSPGKLKIRCSASVHGLYWQSTEISVEEEKPKGPQVMEGTRPSYHEGYFDGVVVEQDILVVQPDTKGFQDLDSGAVGPPLPTIVLTFIGLFVSFR